MSADEGATKPVRKFRTPGWRITQRIKEFMRSGVSIVVDEDSKQIKKICSTCRRPIDGVGRETLTKHAFQKCVKVDTLAHTAIPSKVVNSLPTGNKDDAHQVQCEQAVN
jgi:hypothetical protein